MIDFFQRVNNNKPYTALIDDFRSRKNTAVFGVQPNEKPFVAGSISDRFVLYVCSDFVDSQRTLRALNAIKGGFVYLDPPYDPVSDTASFTGYNKGGFDRSEQIRLKRCCDELTQRGVKFMLSNSATEFIKELYQEYDITIVKAKRAINADASKRGAIEEVLVRNYGTE